MALESVPVSTQSDGKWRIHYTPIAGNPLSAAILNGGTSKPITYGLTADGFTNDTTQATAEDKRLTLVQDLSRPGKVSETASFKVVASTTADSADQVLLGLSISGVESQFTVRRGTDNATTFAAAQIVDVLTGVVGVRRPNAPTENGVDTAEYTLFLTKPTQRQATVVA